MKHVNRMITQAFDMLVVGISSISGGGKTSLAKRIKEALGADNVQIISADNYIKDKSEITKLHGLTNFDQLSAYDHEALERDILALRSGRSIQIPEYTFGVETSERKMITVKPMKVIIIEGLFILSDPRIRKHLDLKIFIDVPQHIALIRRVKRDIELRGDNLEGIMVRWGRHSMDAYIKEIAPARKYADIVVNNEKDFEKALELVLAYLRGFL